MRRIPDWRQYVGIGEQIILSASNMIASLVVVKVSDLAWFGIYSFIFVLSTLAGAFLSTLLHRQMILVIASCDADDRRRVFVATLAIQAVLLLVAAFFMLTVLSVFADSDFVQQYWRESMAAFLFVVTHNFYDLCRQYMYVLDSQTYSFRCTAIYVIALLAGLALVVLQAGETDVVWVVYALFSFTLLLSLLSNRQCQREYGQGAWQGWGYVLDVLVGFLDQGRFRLVGMMVTWLQNQSMNPFLMWLGGPLMAGYFSMARLIVMPIAVVNQGLTNSTTPQLRRLYQTDGYTALKSRIGKFNTLNMGMSGLYLLALLVVHLSGLLEQFVPSYEQVKWYLLIWIATLLVTMYRYWLGQFFVVSMQFRYMMRVGIVSMLVSLGGMVVIGLTLRNVYLALLFVIVGELIAISHFYKRSRSLLV